MSSFYGSARSNYFEVKDFVAFEKEMTTIPDITIIHEDNLEGGLVGIVVDGGDSGCFPLWKYDLEDNTNMDKEEIDIVEIVAGHLAEGAVAIFMEVGAEELRYVSGWAEAINSRFDRKTISLNNIYDVAAGLTTSMKPITHVEY